MRASAQQPEPPIQLLVILLCGGRHVNATRQSAGLRAKRRLPAIVTVMSLAHGNGQIARLIRLAEPWTVKDLGSASASALSAIRHTLCEI